MHAYIYIYACDIFTYIYIYMCVCVRCSDGQMWNTVQMCNMFSRRNSCFARCSDV